ncbi:hypothetical protein D9613_006569 [Agrocybe pediades]|uniref:Uncharacterized protein n=1 Tax=Agrocybe pediades TaxID=84607 RepID=A0A8H4VHU6_9AGAR|nr:hypothetical protein D9613_006569 [Agrocybe pediades]
MNFKNLITVAVLAIAPAVMALPGSPLDKVCTTDYVSV